jgi:hypothetical protein
LSCPNDGNQRRRHDAADSLRREQYDAQRQHANGQRAWIQMRQIVRQNRQRIEHVVRRGITQQRVQFHDDQDAADAGHETGDHRVGHQVDVTAQPQVTEQDLKGAGHQHDREGHGGLAGELGKHRGHDNGHRPCRPRDLRRRAAEQ